MQIASWFALVGAIAGGFGSGLRAWFALKEYEDLVQRADIPRLLRTTATFPLRLVGFTALFHIWAAVLMLPAALICSALSMIWKNRVVVDAAENFRDGIKTALKEHPLVVMFQVQRAVAKNLSLISKSSSDEARRLGELANEAFAWSMVLLGAVGAVIASAIRLWVT
ncbi:hypothetical protein ACIHCV_45415 [Streptomyces sp. NPDC051956]|uniref:hypothetical protein n=1 Tax=Streptomyces sp. NPDC051956 TaxID=3365677 RepID=UPI0037D8D336